MPEKRMFRKPMRLEKWIAFDGAIGVEVFDAVNDAAEHSDAENIVESGENDSADSSGALFQASGIPLDESISLLTLQERPSNSINIDIDPECENGNEAELELPVGFDVPSGNAGEAFLPFWSESVDFDLASGQDIRNYFFDITNPENGTFSFFNKSDIGSTDAERAAFYAEHDLSVGDRIIVIDGTYGSENGGMAGKVRAYIGTVENWGIHTNSPTLVLDTYSESGTSGTRIGIVATSGVSGDTLVETIFKSLTFTPNSAGQTSGDSFSISIYYKQLSGNGLYSNNNVFNDNAGGVFNPDENPPKLVVEDATQACNPDGSLVDGGEGEGDGGDGGEGEGEGDGGDGGEGEGEGDGGDGGEGEGEGDGGDGGEGEGEGDGGDGGEGEGEGDGGGDDGGSEPPGPIYPEDIDDGGEVVNPSEPDPGSDPDPDPDPTPSIPDAILPPASDANAGSDASDSAQGTDSTGEGTGDARADSAGDAAGQDGLVYIYRREDDPRNADDVDANGEKKDDPDKDLEAIVVEGKAVTSAAYAAIMELSRDFESIVAMVKEDRAVLENALAQLQGIYLARNPSEWNELRETLRVLFASGNREKDAINRILDEMHRQMNEFKHISSDRRDGMLTENLRELMAVATRRSGETGALSHALNAVSEVLGRTEKNAPLPSLAEVTEVFDSTYGEAMERWHARVARSDPMGKELSRQLLAGTVVE